MAQGPESRRISILDTTLRDGEQAPGNAMLPEQKLDLALRLESLGVDCVEVAFPASSPNDAEATRLVSQKLTRARFATFSRTNRRDVEIAIEAGGVENHEVQMVATGSDIHLKHKRGITREEAVAEVVDTVAFAQSLGAQQISVGIEDATRGDDELLRALTESALEAGATCIILADTTGCATPGEFGELIARVREWAPPPIGVSSHCHNDLGLALANSLAGIEAGADGVQVTLGGIGERAGNTALEELAAVLAYKQDRMATRTGVDLAGMYDAYNAMREIINLNEPRTKPIFGTYAFGTAAGIHQHGILNNPSTYEFIEPERFGRERSLLIGRHSGRHVLRYMLGQIGVDVDDEQLEELYRVHIEQRPGGDCEDLSTVRERLERELKQDRLPAY
jgi:2-isopropylmalate synthase